METMVEKESVDGMVSHFKQFITDGTTPLLARKALIQIYVNYTRSLVRDPNTIDNDNDNQLYVLAEIIEILSGS